MTKINEKSALPYIVAIILFLILSVTYFSPSIFQNKELRQNDILQFKGMSKEVLDFKEKTGEASLWTNSMFGGMPAYLVAPQFKANIIKIVNNLVHKAKPVSYIFLYLLGFYIALLLFKVDPWLSILGAIAYAFSSYFFIIIEAGHISKVLALGYMPPIIAGVYAAYNDKIWLGSIVTGIFIALQLVVNHFQITYYSFLIILIFIIFQLIESIKEKKIKKFFKPVPVLILTVFLAICSNFSNLWTNYEYSKFSIRGKSELTVNNENQTSGLDKDYATQWSYGIGETFTLLIPNFKGGASHSRLREGSKTFEFLKQVQGKSAAKQYIKAMPTYWGKQPFTSGPVYVGAIIILLAVFGMFVVKGKLKWWILTATIVSILLSWGKNFPGLTNLFLDYFPGYNKFRSVSMILVIAEFTIPLLAVLGLNEILKGEINNKKLIEYLGISTGILGGLIILVLITAGAYNFNAFSDESYLQQGATQFVDALKTDRLSMLRLDAFRSLIFVLLAAGLLWLFIPIKIDFRVPLLFLIVLAVLDLWTVNERYLNSDNFVNKRNLKIPFPKSKADNFILQDNDPNYRVLNMAVNTFNDASTSYYHKSIGGYHGAKMRRYQELIEYHITPDMQALIQTLQAKTTYASIDSTFRDLSVLNMLNTKYVIINSEAPPLYNRSALGNAWFVRDYKLVENADEEIKELYNIDPAKEVIIDKRFKEYVKNKKFETDTAAVIVLTSYKPNHLIYRYSAADDQLVVFSEIYYPKGWEAYIDGKAVPHFRADYVLRAMIVPAGEHEIEYKFLPESFFIGEKISLAGSVLLLFLFAGVLFYELRKKKEEVNEEK